MKYAAYDEYKTSNIGWIRDFPAHWELKRLKYVANRAEVKVEADEDNPLPYIGLEQVEPWTGRLVDLDDDLVPTGISNRFEAGDTLFGKLRPYLAKACNVDFDGLCSSELLVLRGKTYDRKFLLYQLLSHGFVNLVDSTTYGSKMPRASWDFIGVCELPLPPLDEQQTIASFLDAKTAQIDALVAQKRQLIAKLKEKRSALIARTVTRGLPPEAAKAAGLEPNPEMKDSGVEWLKEIPLHWKLSPLKRIVSTPITDGPHETPDFLLEGVPFASAEAVQDGRVQLSSVRGCISREDHEKYSRKYCPKRDDIFVVKSGSTTGKVAIIDFDDEFNVWSPLAAIRCDLTKALPAFVFYALTSEYFQGLVQVSWSFGTQPNIGMGVIGNLSVVLPPPAEQNYIAAFLNTEVARIERLVERAQSAIARLTEYRQALITSAVTGKIDVRDWQAELEAA